MAGPLCCKRLRSCLASSGPADEQALGATWASVVEVMPVHKAGCPCDMFRQLFKAPRHDAGTVYYYRVDAANASAKSFHADLYLPWSSLQPVFEAIWDVAGDSSKYQVQTAYV